ncbi:MAG: hypothetical protein WBE94_22690 [Pseudolabrys sp.]
MMLSNAGSGWMVEGSPPRLLRDYNQLVESYNRGGNLEGLVAVLRPPRLRSGHPLPVSERNCAGAAVRPAAKPPT